MTRSEEFRHWFRSLNRAEQVDVATACQNIPWIRDEVILPGPPAERTFEGLPENEGAQFRLEVTETPVQGGKLLVYSGKGNVMVTVDQDPEMEMLRHHTLMPSFRVKRDRKVYTSIKIECQPRPISVTMYPSGVAPEDDLLRPK